MRPWVAALRPHTLPAAVAPVLVGTAAAARAGAWHPLLAAGSLAVALLLQIGANLLNDVGDFRRGADGPGRRGPVRVVQAGLLSARQVAGAGLGCLALAALLGLVLGMRGGWPLLAVGAAAIAAAALYTLGPWPLAYHGLGEPCVLLFFGPVAVGGTELVQAGRLSPAGLGASLPVGLLAAAILVVNNVRDEDSDRQAGKRTLAVRFGRRGGRALYATCVALAFAAPAALVAAGIAPPAALLAWASAPLVRHPLRAVLDATDGPSLNAALAATARLHLVFGALLAGGLAW